MYSVKFVFLISAHAVMHQSFIGLNWYSLIRICGIEFSLERCETTPHEFVLLDSSIWMRMNEVNGIKSVVWPPLKKVFIALKDILVQLN